MTSTKPVRKNPNNTEVAELARFSLLPAIQAAGTVHAYSRGVDDLDLAGLCIALSEQTDATIDGDLRRGEAMLTAQAHTLDAIFNKLAKMAINTEYVDNLDRYLKLGLRAQSQCRATWETISAIKNPPMMGYVKQANIAAGHQQVNNGSVAGGESSRAGENVDQKTELLEQTDGERLDFGAAGTPSATDSGMAPLGGVDGAENTRG